MPVLLVEFREPSETSRAAAEQISKVGRGRGHDDALRIDHLAHHATRAVAHQAADRRVLTPRSVLGSKGRDKHKGLPPTPIVLRLKS
jgi:hypothetical protein